MTPLAQAIFDVNATTRLRPIEFTDAAAVYVLVDANRAYLRQWLPWLDASRAQADTMAFITSSRAHAEFATGMTWIIEVSAQICGLVGFNRIDPNNRLCEIGYWLCESHNGRGIMTASVRRLVAYAFDDLHLNRVVIRAAAENHRSRAIAQRLGFHQEGVHRQAEWLYDHFVDHVMYSKLRSEREQ